MTDRKYIDTTNDLIGYINTSPTAYHATAESIRRLEEMGFRRFDESSAWGIAPGSRFYVTRNDTSVIGVIVGTEPVETAGFRIAGGHTDFPGLRLKPNGVYTKNGYIQLGVEVYGGPLVQTWLDRDLGLAGRLVVSNDDGSYEIVPFVVKKPVCRIPNLAPHIVPERKDSISYNKQDHLPPVIALGEDRELGSESIKKMIAEAAGVDPAKITGHIVEIIDLQDGTIGGVNDEFVFTRSIDNLAACHALIEGMKDASDETPFTRIIALFDNEEVGSRTMQGADSRFLDNTMERIAMSGDKPRELFFRSIANSLIISVDGAHAINPNYPEAHEPRHHVKLNGGPVVKVNSNERYTTNIEAHEHLRRCAKEREVPLQTFVARTDVGTGSTIGPMTAARLGMRSIDVGSPMVSMHSIREMGGTEDQLHMINLLAEHFSE